MLFSDPKHTYCRCSTPVDGVELVVSQDQAVNPIRRALFRSAARVRLACVLIYASWGAASVDGSVSFSRVCTPVGVQHTASRGLALMTV